MSIVHPISTLHTLPSGISRLEQGLTKIFDKYDDIARLSNEKDEITSNILGAYLLHEPAPGVYELKRSEWAVVPESQGVFLSSYKIGVSFVGLHPRFDYDKLEQSVKDLGKSRGK